MHAARAAVVSRRLTCGGGGAPPWLLRSALPPPLVRPSTCISCARRCRRVRDGQSWMPSHCEAAMATMSRARTSGASM